MQDNASTKVASEMTLPEIQEFLKAGVQFGHETTRWNPKMKKFIFGAKNNIHIIDLEKTMPLLQEAAAFVTEASKKGPVLFVATKRQARDIVKNIAEESGAYYINYRWLGGLLTNFKMIKKSLTKLTQIEDEFEKGVVNRTKFEINQMKKEWERMNRIYCGIKTMDRYPEVVVVVDCNYEKGAVLEAKAAKIPVVSIVDTNSDPDTVDFVIPANDDAIKSITLVLGVLSNAIKKGNPGKWVKHVNKDFSNYQIQIIKKVEVETPAEIEPVTKEAEAPRKTTRKHEPTKGIMEIVKEEAVAKKAEAKKPVAKKPVAKKK